MGVKVRENLKASGTRSLFLDIQFEGKRWKEYLGLHLKPARTKEDRESNQEIKRLAGITCAKRLLELQEQAAGIVPKVKRNQDFIEYFSKFASNYSNKDKRLVTNGFRWFQRYIESIGVKRLKGHEITPDFCRGYIEFMQNGGLRGDTPYNYWTKFKMVVRKAVKEKLIVDNPTEGVNVVRDNGIKKEILSQNEIKLMAATNVQHTELKRAFLFSCLSGLRWVDIVGLKHSYIDRSQGILRFTQSKTKHTSKKSQVIIPLTPTLLKLAGDQKEPETFIFELPSFSYAMRFIKDWAIKAGIQKNITWHSARHSFAVNLLGDAGADIKTVADLLGHAGLKHTEKYLHVVDARKKAAMDNLMGLDI